MNDAFASTVAEVVDAVVSTTMFVSLYPVFISDLTTFGDLAADKTREPGSLTSSRCYIGGFSEIYDTNGTEPASDFCPLASPSAER